MVDVINCEGICRISRLRAVFATMLAAISNQAAQFSRMCLSDIFRKMDAELIHQHRQAHTTVFGKFDQCGHTVSMQFFSPIGQPR